MTKRTPDRWLISEGQLQQSYARLYGARIAGAEAFQLELGAGPERFTVPVAASDVAAIVLAMAIQGHYHVEPL